MNAILNNIPVRIVIIALLVYASLQVHMALGPRDPKGIALIYFTFVALAWWAAEFKQSFLVKAFVYALPDLFIPPIILLPLRNILDSIQISWIIGAAMTIYSTFMVGWMLAAYAKSKSAPAEANV
jgi:hypothetical protein